MKLERQMYFSSILVILDRTKTVFHETFSYLNYPQHLMGRILIFGVLGGDL
jgi:hypothetical protein